MTVVTFLPIACGQYTLTTHASSNDGCWRLHLRAALSAGLVAVAAIATLTPVQAQQLPPPAIAARQYLLVDLTSGRVLAERDADAPVDPASLTKLMTAYVVFGALRDGKLSLEQTLPVSQRAWNERRGGTSVMFIEPRMTPKVDELLKGMIVQSGNDASVALAEGVAGSVEAFVDLMNRQAQSFGLKNTAFRNVTGLTESGHRTTVRDLSVIASRVIADFPQFYTYYSIRSYRFNNIEQPNRNLLLARDPSVEGMKTGFTEAAGYCLIASAVRDFPNLAPSGDGSGKRRLLSVVMNTASMEARAVESQKLLNWGFQAWDTLRLFEAGKPAVTPEVWKGATPTVNLGATDAVYVTVPRGEGDRLQTRVERTDPLVAPLTQGQRVGRIMVATAGGTPVAEIPLVVQEAVAPAGLIGRAWDSLRLWIR
jgi:serine-type D-Ala-D-Ala carboxypeptidase (penicillin-binding protein 5/6)